MNSRDIEWRKRKLEENREQLESGQLNAVRELLPNSVIKEACEDCQYYFRTRLLTPLVVVFHMIGAGISREGSFQSAWQLSGQAGQSGSLAKARRRLPLEVWQRIHGWMMKEIAREDLGKDRWRGHRVIGVDGTCVSMGDEPELFESFGRRWGNYGYARFPLARVLIAFNLQTMIQLGHEVGTYTTGEKSLLRAHLPKFQAGDVLVLDRHYAGANLYAEYKRAGIEFINRIHQSLRLERLEVVEELAKGDLIMKLPIQAAYRRKDSRLPEFVQVRMIQAKARIRGRKETFWIATSLLDPKAYPADEIRAWYKKRWKVEGLIEELKVWLGADVLRSKTAEGILKELYARVIGLNLIHWLILKSAKKHNKSPARLSVSAALRLTAAQSLRMSTAPVWQLPILFEQLLGRMAFSTVPYRPNRIEPRMIKRETKYYNRLKISRTEWRSLHAMAA